jgi:Cytochrome c
MVRLGLAGVVMAALVAAAPAQGVDRTRLIYCKTVAEQACSRCHRVSAEQPPPPPVTDWRTGARVSAPSFMAIARMPATSAAYLRAFLQVPHYPMPERWLPAEDVPYLTAYILSLSASGAPR